jgi:hypothetical protein
LQTVEERTILHSIAAFRVFHIIFICLLPLQVSMFFREWSNIFLADQDERQHCFFADQKQFPADH